MSRCLLKVLFDSLCPLRPASSVRSLREREGEQRRTMGAPGEAFGLGCAALAGALTPNLARAQSDQASLTAFAVHIHRTPQQPWPGYGVYLGNGLILTAAHVAGNVAQ